MTALIAAVLAQSLAPAAQSVLALSTYVGSGIDQLTDSQNVDRDAARKLFRSDRALGGCQRLVTEAR